MENIRNYFSNSYMKYNKASNSLYTLQLFNTLFSNNHTFFLESFNSIHSWWKLFIIKSRHQNLHTTYEIHFSLLLCFRQLEQLIINNNMTLISLKIITLSYNVCTMWQCHSFLPFLVGKRFIFIYLMHVDTQSSHCFGINLLNVLKLVKTKEAIMNIKYVIDV